MHEQFSYKWTVEIMGNTEIQLLPTSNGLTVQMVCYRLLSNL